MIRGCLRLRIFRGREGAAEVYKTSLNLRQRLEHPLPIRFVLLRSGSVRNAREQPMKRDADRPFASRSLFGLNAINFFQAEMVGVIMPILGVLLKERGWRYDAIG